MKKCNQANPQSIVDQIKGIVQKRKASQEALAKIPHEQNYRQKVNEAVTVIHSLWKSRAEVAGPEEIQEDGILVRAYNAFTITEGLDIFSEQGYRANVPGTNHCCFYDKFTFESEDEKEKYIEDVMKELPEGTVCVPNDTTEQYLNVKCTKYSFELKITL